MSGPWEIRAAAPHDFYIADAAGNRVANIPPSRIALDPEGRGGDLSVPALIAAAPELLGALREIATGQECRCEAGHPGEAAIRCHGCIAREAIAKAERPS